MAKKIKKKVLMSWKDVIARWTYAFSVLIGLSILVPLMPWRSAATEPVYHARYSQARYVSLYSMTDKMGAFQPYTVYKREMCMLMNTWMVPNLMTAVAGGVAAATFADKGFSPAVVLGCEYWQLCKNHVTQRCNGYITLMWVGFVVMVLILVSMGMSIAVPCLISSDLNMKANGKKQIKKKDAAMQTTMIASIIAMMASLAAILIYQFTTDMAFKNLKSGAFYPYPAAFVGMYLCWGMVGVQMTGCFCCVTRVYPIGGKQDDDDGDGEADAGGMGPQQSAFGGGVGFAGGPPMMGGQPFLASGPPMGRGF